MSIIKDLFKKNSNNELILYYYELSVCDSIMDGYYTIIEIYIPELEFAINRNGDYISYTINTLITNNKRYENKSSEFLGYKPPKLLKTINISKKSEICKKIIWLANSIKIEKEKKESLHSLFD